MIRLIVGIVIGIVVGILIGSNSPQTFKRNRQALERIAGDALAKAKALALRGKG